VIFVRRLLSALCLLTVVGVRPVPARRAPLHLIHFTTGELSVNVSSTLVLGPTEAIVVDCLAFGPDAAQEADSIANLGTHLTAIYITHPEGAPSVQHSQWDSVRRQSQAHRDESDASRQPGHRAAAAQ
jgi:hypothetical protein